MSERLSLLEMLPDTPSDVRAALRLVASDVPAPYAATLTSILRARLEASVLMGLHRRVGWMKRAAQGAAYEARARGLRGLESSAISRASACAAEIIGGES